MPRTATPLLLTVEQRTELERQSRATALPARQVFRARLLLGLAEGLTNAQVAAQLSTREATVSKWRGRFVRQGLSGLQDAPRSGRPPRYSGEDTERLLAQLDQAPPPGYSRWTGALLAQALGDLSERQVLRVLAANGLNLRRSHSWCVSTDPEFTAKAADLVGLYLAPPENAVVLCVDEKPQIQALERAQGYLRLPNGRALTGFSHEYKRHGTSNLFGALEVATGRLVHQHTKRRRRREFLAFMNRVVAAYPDQEIHVILDNLNTHKPKRDRWLARHPEVHFHYTPTHACWLNMIEVWFSILSRAALQGASFTSPGQLRQAIDDFVEAYQETATPFEWTKEVVYQSHPKKRYADLRR